VGGEPAEKQCGGAARDARWRRDLWLAAPIWQRRETKPVWAGAGPSGLHRPIGQLGQFGRVDRRKEVGRLQGLKKEMGCQGRLGGKGNWAAGIEFKF
jgi:hypothetical protein